MELLKFSFFLWMLFGSIIGVFVFMTLETWLPWRTQEYTRLHVIVTTLVCLIFPAITTIFMAVWLTSVIQKFICNLIWKRVYHRNSKLYKWLNGKAFRP